MAQEQSAQQNAEASGERDGKRWAMKAEVELIYRLADFNTKYRIKNAADAVCLYLGLPNFWKEVSKITNKTEDKEPSTSYVYSFVVAVKEEHLRLFDGL